LTASRINFKMKRLWIRNQDVQIIPSQRPASLATGLCPILSSERISSRALIVIVCAVVLVSAACGGKKKTSVRVPAPPSIDQQQQTATAVPPSSAPESKPPIEFDPDAKVIWTQTGFASWYGPNYHNRKGANGEIYDMNQMTAAHNSLPMNSIVRVTNLKTNHSAILKITDRGPFVMNRIIDLSKAAAIALDVYLPGTAKVRIDVLEAPHEIDTGGRWCVQVGAFDDQEDAIKLKEKLMRRYHTAKVLQFPGPTGYWVRVKVLDDDKKRAQEVADNINVSLGLGGVFLVRLD
jgi:rare lipoprotein A